MPLSAQSAQFLGMLVPLVGIVTMCPQWATMVHWSDKIFVGFVGLVRHGQMTSLWAYEKKLSMSTLAYIIIICRHHRTSWGFHGGSMRNMLINLPLVFYLLLSKPKVLNNIIVPDGKVGTR